MLDVILLIYKINTERLIEMRPFLFSGNVKFRLESIKKKNLIGHILGNEQDEIKKSMSGRQ